MTEPLNLYRSAGHPPALSMICLALHRWLCRLLFTGALLMPLAAIGADDPDAFIQQWQIDEAWTGDLDGMVERRKIRVLVAHNKLMFFFDKAQIRGITYDVFLKFEEYINRKLKTGSRKISVVFLPVPRDKLLPWLATYVVLRMLIAVNAQPALAPHTGWTQTKTS
jgi:hypothetical protein